MTKIMSLIRRAPKRFSAVVAMVAAAIVVPLAVNAWGPDRPTFTSKSPASYVTFNSMTDNPDVGDERNFVRVRPAGTGNYSDNVNLEAGKTYDVMVYYHNNAATRLNASGEGIAKDTLLRMQMAADVQANSSTKITGFISASNAKPGTVYDSATLTNKSAGAMDLGFVAGSAKVTSNGKVNGATLSNNVFTTGASLGFDSLNGQLPGCNEFAGYVVFQVKANQPNFTVSKQVHKTDTTGWKETESAKPGDKVDFLVTYKNTGSTTQNNVVLKDVLPKGMTYVKGTTIVANATNPNGLTLDAKSDTATTTGVNIGNYKAGASAYVKLTAKIDDNANLPACGLNTLTNTAEIQTDNGSKSDTAQVTVTKDCPKPVVKYSCDTLKITKVDRTNFKFNITFTAQNASLKSVTYTVKNEAGTTVASKTIDGSAAYNYTQTTPGKFTVQAVASFMVDGVVKTAPVGNCKGSFEVAKPPVKDIKVCELETKKIITIKEDKFDAKKHSKNLDDCKVVPPVGEIVVCELETKEVITIKETAFDSSKHSKDLNDCKEVPSVTPPELPQTGAGENIAALIGLGALIASTGYYIASRRALS